MLNCCIYVGQLTMNAIQHSQSPQCLHRTEGGHLALTARDEVERSRQSTGNQCVSHHTDNGTQIMYFSVTVIRICLYLFLCNFELFIQHYIAHRQFLVLLQKGLTNPCC